MDDIWFTTHMYFDMMDQDIVAKSEKIYYRLSNWIDSTKSIISSIVATQIFRRYDLSSIYTPCTLKYKTIHIYFYSLTHLYRVSELHRP